MRNFLYISVLLLLVINSASAQTLSTAAGNGTSIFAGDGGLANQASINKPFNICVDPYGNLYIADEINSRIRRVDKTTSIITTVAGGGSSIASGIPALTAGFSNPHGVAVDSSGNVYICDTNHRLIRKVDAATAILTNIAGTGSSGYSGDGGQATAATFTNPISVCLDRKHNMYFSCPSDHRIRKVNLSTGIITTVAGTGGTSFNGDGIPATSANINSPWGLTIDTAGNLYIAERYNPRIRRVDAVTGLISTVGGTGTTGYNGDGIAATTARLNEPIALCTDPAGNVYIADMTNFRVRKITLATGMITTIAGNGSAGYSPDGTVATSAMLNNIFGMATDGACAFYISDSYNSRIRLLGNGSPTIFISTPTPAICMGALVTFASAPGGGGSTPTFQWKVNGTAVGTNPTFSSSTLKNNDTVTCTMVSSLTCSGGSTAQSNSIIMKVGSPVTAGVVIAVPDTICMGSPVNLSLTGSTGSIHWQSSPSGSGFTTISGATQAGYTSSPSATTYYRTYSDSGACADTAAFVQVVVLTGTDTAKVSIGASATTICPGDNVIFSATPGKGGSTPTYQWKLNGVNVGTNNPSYNSSTLKAGDTVRCEMTSSLVCVAGSPATSNPLSIVMGNSAVAGTVTASADTICYGTPVNLLLSGHAGSIHWQASPTTGGFSTVSGASQAQYTDVPLLSTYYRVYVDSGLCSDTSAYVKVEVVPAPVAQYSFTNSGLQVNFNSAGSSSDVTTYYWDFGDTTYSSAANPAHTFTHKDTFNVCLTVYNNSNCSYTLCQDVILLPTGISSQQGGISSLTLYPVPAGNDVSIVTGGLRGNYQLVIYNALGQKMRAEQVVISDSQTLQLDLTNLAAGTYELVLFNATDYCHARFLRTVK